MNDLFFVFEWNCSPNIRSPCISEAMSGLGKVVGSTPISNLDFLPCCPILVIEYSSFKRWICTLESQVNKSTIVRLPFYCCFIRNKSIKNKCPFLNLFRLQQTIKPIIVYARHKDVIWQNIWMKEYNGGLLVKLVLFFLLESAKLLFFDDSLLKRDQQFKR